MFAKRLWGIRALAACRQRFGLTLAVVAVATGFGASQSPTQDELAERRAKVEAKTPAEKEQLLQRLKVFVEMTPDEQERMRELDEALNSDPTEGAQLRSVMDRYYDWFRTLTPLQQAELDEIPDAAKRIERIKEFRQEQMGPMERAGLTRPDRDVIRQWKEEIAREHKDDLLNHVSPDERKAIEQRSPQDQILNLVKMLQTLIDGNPPTLPPWIDAESLARLSSKLSPGAQKKLQEAATPVAKAMLIRQWTRFAPFDTGPRGGRGRGASPPAVKDDDLMTFFRTVLSEKDRSTLILLSPEEFKSELLRQYLRRNFQRGPRSDQPGGPDKGPQRGKGPGGAFQMPTPNGFDGKGFDPPPGKGNDGGRPPYSPDG